MGFKKEGPSFGLVTKLLLVTCVIGYAIAETEKDFEFAGEKESYRDDEDFLADEGGSGDIEGSGGNIVDPGFAKGTGIPTLYRCVINVTSVKYTPEIAALGRDIHSLAVTQQLQAAIQTLLTMLPGTIRVRVVDLQPGSLMVTFDIDTDGNQSEEDIKQLLQDILNSGDLKGFSVSPQGFEFKQIRDIAVCAPGVGRIPSALPTSGNIRANLMVNNAFPCDGFIVSWSYYRTSALGEAFIGIFRQSTDTEFALIHKTLVPEAPIGQHTLVLMKPLLVHKGDFIGVFYAQNARSGVLGLALESDNAVPEAELYQNYYVSLYESDLPQGRSFRMSDFTSQENKLTYAIQAEMSYLNVPVVTSAPQVACTDSQWTCKNGDCISRDYYCDTQVDCYDGSDEENCPTSTCRQGEFTCASGQQCIPQTFVCNFINDCGDNSDERDCGPEPVRITSYRDGSDAATFELSWIRPQDGGRDINAYVIKYRLVSVRSERDQDGGYLINSPITTFLEAIVGPTEERYQLRNLQPGSYYQVEISAQNTIGASEPQAFIFKTANPGCARGEWQCNDGGCVSVAARCDSSPDCADDSDELNCDGPICNEGLVACPQPDGRAPLCVEEAVGCAVTCAEDEFQCLDGRRCINFLRLCDGRVDCDDQSDENNCECADGEFQCINSRQCISEARRCDNRNDCDDGSDENNCPCPQDTFQCVNTPGQECISTRALCDGTADCTDGSDELNCPARSCQSWQFQCRTSRKCIDSRRQCDRNFDCADGSDEQNCGRGCPTGQWECNDGGCLPDRMRCDGVPQCEDLTDEVGCTVTCRPDQFTCKDGNCVEGRMRCDDIPQCEDSSDEDGCPCPQGMFQCADSNCVEGFMKCDGVPQCEDSSDELGCPTNCPPSDFQCVAPTSGGLECIDKRLQCDDYEDCSDGSDEVGCAGCRRDEYTCADDSCAPASARCNGVIECADRSDELGCVCTADQFRCGDGICISLSSRCDRRIDCQDRSDEIACPCRSGEFQCVNGDCIDQSGRCDGRYDCQDRTDEEGCQRRRRCQEGYFQCGTGHCLSEDRVCDNYNDCPDSSDEQNCTLNCASGELECIPDNKCITPDLICNRIYDCSDGTDELTCQRCTDAEFQCEADRSCISLAGRCNGRKECSDGSDEMGCPTRPPISVVVSPRNLRIRAGTEAILMCLAQGLPQGASVEWTRGRQGLPMQSAVEQGKLMIPVAKPMDSGDYTCTVVGVPGDYRDTARLEVVDIGPTPGPEPNRTCGRDEAVCQNGQCIRREYRCDGEPDCADGSDEPNDCNNNLCEPNEFQCTNGQCVMKIWRCDGENDCDDGFDESNCEPRRRDDPCERDEFQCLSGDQCVPLAYQCDQEIDCLDRSDEIGCSPPIITVPPISEIEVELGSTFTVICEAVGVPTPLIVWRLNWGNIPTGPRVKTVSEDGKGMLVISDARYTDAGAYTCEAINNRGSIFAIPDALIIVRRQKGPCDPPFFNLGAVTSNECVRCFCFGQSVQCFSSDLQLSRIALASAVSLVNKQGEDVQPVEQRFVDFRPTTREYVALDMDRGLPQGRYYWSMPKEFLGERLTSYGGELKYTISYEIRGRTSATTSDPDVIISGNGLTLYYRGRTRPSPGVPTSFSVPLIESAWERTDGSRRGDTPVDTAVTREDLMTVLEDVKYILVRAGYDRTQTSVRIGGIFMTTAVDYPTEYGQAVLVEDCTCTTGYTGLSCQNCAPGFTRIQTGSYLGQCVSCNCNGHSNDCERRTGQCLNCQHNTEGPQCQVCLNGFYGDPRQGTPNDCQRCPCPLTDPANQFSSSCYLETDNAVTCNCPLGYEGRRCERCAAGYVGDPMTPGSSCRKAAVEYCDSRGSVSTQANPLTRRCTCKKNTIGDRCDSCKANTFYLSNGYELGCVACFCSGVSKTCQSTSWNRARVSAVFNRDDEGFRMIDRNYNELDNQRFQVDGNNRELTYRLNTQSRDVLYWSLPSRFLGDKVGAYGGSLRFTVRYMVGRGGAVDSREPMVRITGNDITLSHRSRTTVQPNRTQSFNVMMYEQNWLRSDGQPATREHLLMALADLNSINIRASYEDTQTEVGLRDVSLDIAEDRQTRQDRAYAVEQCVCPVGYRGLSCEDCDTGYTRTGGGLYLGLCEPCKCNGHSGECDPESGVCRNCQHNTAGDYCETCDVGYYGDASRGSRTDCQACSCPLTESPNQFSSTCILDTDRQLTCTGCPTGHTGRRCESCISGYTGNPLAPGDYCKPGAISRCDCDRRGTVPNTQCDEVTKQCQCKPYTQGSRCARCREGHFYLESNNSQGCLTCYCSGITNQCTSSSYYRVTITPNFVNDGTHNFVLLNRRMNNKITEGFTVNRRNSAVTFDKFEGVQKERESLFFQLPAKFRGDQVTSYGGYLRFTLEFTARSEGRMYRDVDLEIISSGQSLRLYNLFEPSLQEGRPTTYEILLRESSFNDLRSNTAPTRETFMTLLSNIEGILIRATHHENMASVTLRDISMDSATAVATDLGGAPMVEDCRCPEGYTGLSCERCAQGYLRVSDGRDGLDRCVRCNCNGHASSCDPATGRCLDCQDNTEGDRCERCIAGYYGDPTSATPTDCVPCTCPLSRAPNQFSRTCYLAEDKRVTCDRCPTGYTGRTCDRCAQGYIGDPTILGETCRPNEIGLRPNVTVGPRSIDEPVGATVVFQCRVTGQGPFKVIWSRLDSRQLPDRAFKSPQHSLTIRDLAQDDSGRYVCTATNTYGVTRGTVELRVRSGQTPLQVRIDRPRMEIDEGRTARFTCTAVSTTRGMFYILSWSKQGGTMPSKALDQNGVLTIPNVNRGDAGNYICTGSDMVTMDEEIAVLIISEADEPAPTVRIEPRYQTVDEGSQVKFVCLATGTPAPKIEWYRGSNRELNPEATVIDGVLTIPRARLDDEADYFCRATNEAGTTEVRTILYITRVERPEVTIIVRKTSYITIAGQTAVLECYTDDVTGRVTLVWSRPRVGLPTGSSQDNGFLTIPNVQPSYAGNYVCTGTDRETGRIGTAVAILEVNVETITEAPQVKVEPSELTVAMGTTGTLRCSATGIPEPTVTWIRSRGDLSPNHQVNGNVLRITKATMEDRGIYVCRATNSAGSDQDWSTVEVERRMRPKIDIYPNATQVISVGSSALFQCRVMDGDPPPTITWSRVGGEPMSEKIELMDNGVIMFKQVTQAEQGAYLCTANNDMGVITATATLHVEGPPTITITPSKTVYALIGQRVTLECSAEGDPTPSVYWIQPTQRRRGDIAPESSAFLGEPGSAVLDINNVDREDEGTYRCVATNAGGRTEDRVQLVIREQNNQGVSIRGPSTLSVVEGQSVELVCSSENLRNAVIRWRRRNGNMPPGHSVSRGVLTLPAFRSEYAGEYICSTTIVPQRQSYEASVFIIVQVTPRLTISPQRITTRAGETIQLRCTASGSGPFNIEWSRVDGQMNPRSTEREGILEIRQVSAVDAGRYRCVVQSSAGTSEGYAIVEVEVPPTVIVSKRDVYSQINTIAELRCDVTGSPAPTIRWSKENGDLPAQHRIQNGVLTIYNVQAEDGGRYICSATSQSGTSRDYAVLHVEAGPDIDNGNTGNVDTQIVNVGDRVSMECIVTGTPIPTITWTRDDGPLPRDVILGDGILIIPQAKIEDAGTYTCLATNKAGSISSKVVLYVRAKPQLRAPSSATAALGERVSLVCDSGTFPSPDITWFRKDGEMPDDYTIVDGDLVINRVRPEDAGNYVCSGENEYGRTDTPVSLNVGDMVPHFQQDPKSYMVYDGLNDVYLKFDIMLSLKPESTEGMVLYNGQFEDGGGDFVCFGLNEGYPEFRFDVGSGPAIIRGNRTLELDQWHTVKLSRDKKKGTMVVNNEPAYTGESPGYFTGLDIAQNLYLGSVPDYGNIPVSAGFRDGFVGAVSEMKLQGISVNLGAEALEIVGVTSYNTCKNRPCQNQGTCVPANVRDGYKCMCPQGYTGQRCEEIGFQCYPGACGRGRCYNLEGRSGFRCLCPLGKTGSGCLADITVINPFFNQTSFISYPATQNALFSLAIYLEYKPRSLSDGIVLYEGNSQDGSGDFMALVQKDGYLEFRFDTGSGPAVVRSRSPLKVNEWTRVTATRQNREGTLTVNDEEPVTGTSPGSTRGLNLKQPLYLGGPDPTYPVPAGVGVTQGFVGCVAELQVNDVKIDLLNDAIESSNVIDCGERRLCERQPCKNGAVCEDLAGPDYRCLCANTHKGKNCEVELNICLTNNPCQNSAPCSITDDGYRCDCQLGYSGTDCQFEINIQSDMSFSGDGFIEFTKDMLPHSSTQERQTVSFTMVTTAEEGLILWQGEPSGTPLRGGDHFSIGVKGGYLRYGYEMGSGPANIVSLNRVDDGRPHNVTVERLGRSGTLTIDNDASMEGESQPFLEMLNADGNIFIGGVSLLQAMTDGKYSENYSGCIRDLIIHGKGPLLPKDAIKGYNVDKCY